MSLMSLEGHAFRRAVAGGRRAASAAEGTMSVPRREAVRNNQQTYFLTICCWNRRRLFEVEANAKLMMQTIQEYKSRAFLLHDFVLMPDHLHLLLTPSVALERAVQFVKGGYSFRYKKLFGSNLEIWQRGYTDHRIRDAEDYRIRRGYLLMNPVRAKLCQSAMDYPWSSASHRGVVDDVPQWLKPLETKLDIGTAEAVPFQKCEPHQHTAILQGRHEVVD
ncbi:MAG: hypothetical protein NVS9B15_25790 [Acidobacteriaceae bacterium]